MSWCLEEQAPCCGRPGEGDRSCHAPYRESIHGCSVVALRGWCSEDACKVAISAWLLGCHSRRRSKEGEDSVRELLV